MSEKTIHQRSHRQLSMFEDGMNLVPYTSPKKGIGTVERLNDYEGFTEKFKPRKTTRYRSSTTESELRNLN